MYQVRESLQRLINVLYSRVRSQMDVQYNTVQHELLVNFHYFVHAKVAHGRSPELRPVVCAPLTYGPTLDNSNILRGLSRSQREANSRLVAIHCISHDAQK